MKGYQLFIKFLHSKGYKVDTSSELATFEYNNGHVAFLGGEDDVVSIVFKYVFQEEIDQNLYEELCDEMNAEYNGAVRFSISSNSQNLFIEHPFYCTEGCNELVHFEEVLNLIMELKNEFKERLQIKNTVDNTNALILKGLQILLDSRNPTTDKEAIEIFKTAEQQNHFCAKDAINIVNINRKNRNIFINILAGTFNDINCSYTLGCAYEQGDGLPQSYEDAARWYRVAAEQGHAKAQCNLGWLYATGSGVAENIQEAKKWYTKAAENGDATAMANLFNTYWTEANYAEAQKWAEKAREYSDNFEIQQLMERMEVAHLQIRLETCDDIEEVLLVEVKLGNRVAMFNLGQYYLENMRDKEGFSWMMKCTEFNAPAKYYVGACYAKGTGVPENKTEAFKWMKEAADSEYPEAQYVLGLFYIEGYGTEVDEKYGLSLIKEAAQNGFEDAQNYLSERGIEFDDEDDYWEDYTDSDDEEVSLDSADVEDADAQFQIACHYMENEEYEVCVEWLEKAASQNHVNAQSILGLCYYNGEGVSTDYGEAIKWFRKAADQGNSEAQLNMGLCYSKGHGVGKNDNEAFKWFSKSADQGNGDAQSNLAACYISGLGVSPNKTLAAEWYRKAADNGSVDGQYGLGYCLISGFGVQPNIAEGKAMLEAAARQGHGQAQALLDRIKAEEEKQNKKTSGFFKKLFS